MYLTEKQLLMSLLQFGHMCRWLLTAELPLICSFILDPDTQYLGQTKRRLHQRIKEHIRGNSTVGSHLNICPNCSNDINNRFSVKYTGRDKFETRIVEALLINDKTPRLNQILGLNGKSLFLKVLE